MKFFGPVLSVVRAKSYEEGVALINFPASNVWERTAIVSQMKSRFQQEVEVGMIAGINVPFQYRSRVPPASRVDGSSSLLATPMHKEVKASNSLHGASRLTS
jgi:acyl-CoA reductase-like NAD-dependent aldehyde dehydrogenase